MEEPSDVGMVVFIITLLDRKRCPAEESNFVVLREQFFIVLGFSEKRLFSTFYFY